MIINQINFEVCRETNVGWRKEVKVFQAFFVALYTEKLIA